MYQKTKQGQLAPHLYSKLSLIEVGGWAEMTMDDLIRRSTRKSSSKKYIEEKIIEPNSGFSYEKNFRRMLIQAVGIVAVDQIEKNTKPVTIQKLKTALGNLKKERDGIAHTYIKDIGTTTRIASPSVAISYFKDIHDGLKDIESVMRNLRLL